MTYPSNSDGVAQDQLVAFVERIERLEEEARAINSDKSEVYKEAKGNGFDVKVLKRVVAERRMDRSERLEREAIFDLYWNAVNGLAHARVETIEEIRPGGASEARLPPKQEAAGSSPAPVATIPEPVEGAPAGAADALTPVPQWTGAATREDAEAAAPVLTRQPGCQHPDACAGTWRARCYACEKAWTAAQGEAA